MANRSYLVCCDFDGMCPSERWPRFDPVHHVLAYDVCCVPLLWLALFRRSDLRVTSLAEKSGQHYPYVAPVAPVAVAREQILAAVPALNHLFGHLGAFDEWAAVFRQVLDNPPGKYVSLELTEIACLSDFSEFVRELRAALQVLSEPLATVRSLPQAPLNPIRAPTAPSGLRGKAAVAFLVEQTKLERNVVERVLENLHGDSQKALDFFEWQARQSAPAKGEAWESLANLASLRLDRPLPKVGDALANRLTDRDDDWNVARLVGASYLRQILSEQYKESRPNG
jgi:hypothetical protein